MAEEGGSIAAENGSAAASVAKGGGLPIAPPERANGGAPADAGGAHGGEDTDALTRSKEIRASTDEADEAEDATTVGSSQAPPSAPPPPPPASADLRAGIQRSKSFRRAMASMRMANRALATSLVAGKLGALAPSSKLRSSVAVVSIGHFFVVATLPALRYIDAYSLDARLVWLPYTQGSLATVTALLGVTTAFVRTSTTWATLYAMASIFYGSCVGALTLATSALMVELCGLEQASFRGCSAAETGDGACGCLETSTCIDASLASECPDCTAYSVEVCDQFQGTGAAANGFYLDALAAAVMVLMGMVSSFYALQLTVREQTERATGSAAHARTVKAASTRRPRPPAEPSRPAREPVAGGVATTSLDEQAIEQQVATAVARVSAEMRAHNEHVLKEMTGAMRAANQDLKRALADEHGKLASELKAQMAQMVSAHTSVGTLRSLGGDGGGGPQYVEDPYLASPTAYASTHLYNM